MRNFPLFQVENSQKPPEAWAQWVRRWNGLFTLIFAGLTGYVILEGNADRVHTGFFASLLAVWFVISLRWQNAERMVHPPYLLAYYAAGWLVWFALTDIHPIYLFALFILFPHLYISLPLRWASVGAMLLMLLTILRQVTLNEQTLDKWLILGSIMTIAGIILAYFIDSIIKESMARRDLIQKLEATQQELAAAERQTGILQERQRLAGEIHDTVAQGLIGIIAHLEAAEGALKEETKTAQTHVDQAKRMARDSLAEARRFIWGLRPAALEKQPLEIGLRQVVEDWSASNQILAHWLVTGSRIPLSNDQETTLLRVLQESLHNITKHAQATQVRVTLSYLPEAVIIDIQDNGKGFDQGVNGSGDSGYGLPNMGERLKAFQGHLIVESAPGEGTTIVAEMRMKAK